MTDFYKKKTLIDVTGRPIPQYYDEEKGVFIANTNGTGDASNVDFRKKKMLIDVQSFPIPQYYDVGAGVFKPITSEGSSNSSGPISWDDITGKPSEFKPATHGHKTSDVEGLDERLTEVFTQVSNGKSLLETVIFTKGVIVEKVNDVPTFDEIRDAILKINGGSNNGDADLIYGATDFTDLVKIFTSSYSIGNSIYAKRNMSIHGITLIVPKVGKTTVTIANKDLVKLTSVDDVVNVTGQHYDIFFAEPINIQQGEEFIVYYDTSNTGFYDLPSNSYSVSDKITLLKALYSDVGTVPVHVDGNHRGVFPIFSLN